MRAIFPGSFDPITNGHLDLIKRAARLCDEVIVIVASNTHKKGLFTIEERYKLVEAATASLENVKVKVMPNMLTVDMVHELNADTIVRGVRNAQDFIYEQQIALMNKEMDPNVETIILFSKDQYSHISSSIIREIAYFKGDLEKSVPKVVQDALTEKYTQISQVS